MISNPSPLRLVSQKWILYIGFLYPVAQPKMIRGMFAHPDLIAPCQNNSPGRTRQQSPNRAPNPSTDAQNPHPIILRTCNRGELERLGKPKSHQMSKSMWGEFWTAAGNQAL
jgi:hypothetical protein